MKKILFPTDFSEAATNAFIYALELAKIVKGELILLHTFELPLADNVFYPINYKETFDTVELSKFEQFREELPKLRAIAEERNLGHISMSHRLMEGLLIPNIKECIENEKINFVVMGTAGTKGCKELFISTNTGDVISAVPIPVLSVPVKAKFEKIETIGFTTRFREKDKVALEQAIDIAKKTNAKIKCLYVKTQENDNINVTIKDWKNQFKNDPVRFYIIPGDNVKETIIDFITSQEIDVLTMITYKRNFFESLFNSSLTKKMSYKSEIPILVLHV
ncbi:universal stress protein [Flavobacterium luteum]|uniref:Universal stress protein n=1 Tax=Flavobacterium luteum TaxID=2026654 RepID=A0A7J5ADD1_9FLAO|nr:universal stress protein [Flavobacterium luteum]KAB1155574.1 universal stress protein [Flavobacterium luteum]